MCCCCFELGGGHVRSSGSAGGFQKQSESWVKPGGKWGSQSYYCKKMDSINNLNDPEADSSLRPSGKSGMANTLIWGL